jgi:hypothetical protein
VQRLGVLHQLRSQLATNWEKKGWKKLGGEIKNLEIIQNCYAIYRRIEEELKLNHVAAHIGTEGNELAHRMAMLGVQRKEKNCVCIGNQWISPRCSRCVRGDQESVGQNDACVLCLNLNFFPAIVPLIDRRTNANVKDATPKPRPDPKWFTTLRLHLDPRLGYFDLVSL